jgi:hypothetical protein
MAGDPIKHFDQNIATRPTLNTIPATIDGVTRAPDRELFITAALTWTDGHEEAGTGWARAWTKTAVLVDVETSRGHYVAWIPAADVTRRTPPTSHP